MRTNGGFMSYRYACERAGRVAAMVSQAGAMWNDPGRCRPVEPVAVLQIHGTADTIVPYAGRPRQSPHEGATPSARQSVAAWVALDRCRPEPDASAPALDLVADETGAAAGGAETTLEKWGGCRGVELWTMHGAEHRPRLQGAAMARAMLGWLRAHPKP